jgi:hypothetical protein
MKAWMIICAATVVAVAAAAACAGRSASEPDTSGVSCGQGNNQGGGGGAPICSPGDTIGCTCADGALGLQACLIEGGMGPCETL